MSLKLHLEIDTYSLLKETFFSVHGLSLSLSLAKAHDLLVDTQIFSETWLFTLKENWRISATLDLILNFIFLNKFN